MNVTKTISGEPGRLKKLTLRHTAAAVLAALLVSGIALLQPPMDMMTLSAGKWLLTGCIPFFSMFGFFALVRCPKCSVFRFTKYLYLAFAPAVLILLTGVVLDTYKAELYSQRYFAKFFPLWLCLWLIGTAAAYAVMRIAQHISKDGASGGSSCARIAYALAVMYTPQKKISRKSRIGKGKWVAATVCVLLVALAVFIGVVTLFLHSVYSNMEFEAILFTVRFAEGGLAWEDLIAGFTLVVLFLIVAGYIGYHMVICLISDSMEVVDERCGGKYTLVMNAKKRVLNIAVSVVLLATSAVWFSSQTNFAHYIGMKQGKSDIYEQSYVKPDSSVLTFPEKKRNLIYIYLESIENTYASKELGGSQDKNYLAGLAELAQDADSVNFSNTDKLGGASVFVPSISYTQGSTVAQTSGIALNIPLSQIYKAPEYPNMTRLEDILHDNGYNQLYIEGSKGEFSMYDKYVGRYGDSRVFDRKTASDEGYSDENADYIWKWGIEDRKLADITKELITDISKKDKPFFVTMYTMDTHTFECGHRCKACDSSISNDYLASVDCSSRTVCELVEWIKQQPFYENTTIILVGDHLGNRKTAKIDVDDSYVRTTYNCIINPAKKASKTTERIFSSLDMFPTTLSAIGAQIKGDRLGLGTDLFSDTKTLCEELGAESYKRQLEQSSDYYDREFFGK